MYFKCFRKLYESLVLPVIHYADIKCRTWFWKTIQFFKINRLECLITSTGRLDKNHSLKLVSSVATSNFKAKWKKVISAEKSRRGLVEINFEHTI